MLELKNDEERKAMRLAKIMWDAECINEHDVRMCMCVLVEARAIFREEQAAKDNNTRSRRVDDELDKVRADITRTAVVVQAMAAALNLYGEEKPPKNETDALSEQENKLRDLLVRERELMKPAKG